MVLQTAVIGAGIVSENNHLPAVSRNPRTQLLAICDRDEQAVREAVRDYGGQAYTDAKTMFTEENLDWVHVATPVQSHFDLASTAIERETPVTVQKPATTTRDELDDLRQLADENDVLVSVVHNWLFYPIVRELRQRIAADEFGEIRAVETSFSGEGRPDDTYRGEWVYDLPGGDVEEGMPHPLYLTLTIGGVPRDPDAVDVQTRSIRDYAEFDYDGTALQWTTDHDVLCSVTFVGGSAPNNQIRVYGSEKSATVDLQTNTIDAHDADEGPFHFLSAQLDRSATTAENIVEGAIDTIRIYGEEQLEAKLDHHRENSADGHYYLFDDTAKAIERGEQPPVSLGQSYWVLELLEQVRSDAKERTDI